MDRSGARRPAVPLRHRLLRRPDPLGLVAGLVFWWASLSPSLLPRPAPVQGVIGALSFLVGYALGVLVRLLLDVGVSVGLLPLVGERIRRRAGAVVLAVTPLLLVAGSVWWLVSQNDQRPLVGVEELGAGSAAVAAAVTVLATVVLLGLGRLIGAGIVGVDRLLERVMPAVLAHALLALLVPVVAWVVTDDVLVDRAIDWVDDSYASSNTGTAPGLDPPTSALVSGGPGSAVSWESLGYYGRSFVADGPSAADIEALHPDAGATEPIRVYAGTASAEGDDAQARLVVEELERTGAFDRSVLAVWATTGTGWVDPVAAAGLEVLQAGDTAIAAMQYSYLPSWISFLVDADKTAASATALFEAVHARWSELPEPDRPLLVVFGESLGSLGSEHTFAGDDATASLDALTGRTDAVLYVGPTSANPIWRQLIDGRDPETPSWRPTYGDGTTVRFAQSGDGLLGDPAPAPPHVQYLQHPSDPVGWIDLRAIWAPPDWMAQPRGPDVSPQARWFPVVTFLQGISDLMAGFSASPGHGHNYDPDVVAGWYALLPVPGWSTAQLDELTTALMARYPQD